MLYTEIITVCPEIHIKHANAICKQNIEFLDVNPGGTYCNHGALKG